MKENEQGVNWRIILKHVRELGYEAGDWTDILQGLMASFCEHDNELSGYLIAWTQVVVDGDVKQYGLDISDQVTRWVTNSCLIPWPWNWTFK